MNDLEPGAPRRVLMTADAVGGVWPYAVELIDALGAYEIEVVLATMGPPLSPAQRHEAERLSNLELRESRYQLEWMPNPWADVQRAADWLLELERETDPDLIHLNGYAHGGLPWRAPVLVVGHSCLTSWWRAVKGRELPPHWRRYQDTVRQGIRAADMVVAPTHAMRNSLQYDYGRLPALRVIPNARNPRRFVPDEKQDFVLSAGRLWDEAKNLQAVARLAPELPWPVRIAGAARSPEGRRVAFDHVEWLGQCWTEEMAQLYGNASLYVLPARYEPFGLTVLEAALAGCALVLGDVPSLRENWEEAALWVPPEDPEALRQATLELIQNAGQRQSLGYRAWRRALDFSPERQAAAYVAAYAAAAVSPVAERADEDRIVA